MGNYKEALVEYQSLKELRSNLDDNTLNVNIAICLFYLGITCVDIINIRIQSNFFTLFNKYFSGSYSESQEIIDSIPISMLKMRLLFHLAHKLNDEDRLLELHGSLRNTTEDQLSLACMHYLRAHYQDAIDVYKRILLEKKYV